MHVSSKRGSSSGQRVAGARPQVQEGQLPPPALSRAQVRSLDQWLASTISALSRHYARVVMAVRLSLPGQSPDNLRELSATGARSEEIPAMVDGGQGVPVSMFCAVIASVFVIVLVRMAMQTRGTSASDKTKLLEGKEAGLKEEMRWWHTCVLLQLGGITGCSEAAYASSLPVIAEEFHATESMVGLSLQVNWVSSGVFACAIGILSDKYGRRPALFFALSCYVVGSLLCAISPSCELFIAMRCIMGIGSCEAVAQAVIRDWIPDEESRSQMLSLFMMTVTMSIIVAPVIGGVIATLIGWRMVFVVLAAWGLSLLWNVLELIPETCPKLETDEATDDGFLGPIFEVSRKSLKPLGLMLVQSVLIPLDMGMASTMSWVFGDVYGANTIAISGCIGVQAAGGFAGSLLSIALLQHWTSWQVIRGCMLGHLLVAATILGCGLLQLQPSMVIFEAIPVIFYVFMCAHIGPLYAMSMQPFGDAAGTVNGIMAASIFPAAAVFGFFFTKLFEVGGLFAWMLGVAAIAFLHQGLFWGCVGAYPDDDPIFKSAEDTTAASDESKGKSIEGSQGK